jgi:hypothetical protein
MGQRHLPPGLAGPFLDLVPVVEYLAQHLIGERPLGAGRRRQKSAHGGSNPGLNGAKTHKLSAQPDTSGSPKLKFCKVFRVRHRNFVAAGLATAIFA